LKITNKFGLPQPFVDLVSEDSYDPGASDITTTGLIGPPKIRALFSRHANEIVEDASDKVRSMNGTAKHYILEQIAKRNPKRYVTEVRFYHVFDGIKVGGQIDLFDRETETLYDWKNTTAWKVTSGDFYEFAAQGNINKFLCEENGLFPKKLSNIAVIDDWKKREAKLKPSYPQCGIAEIPLPVWKREETIAYIKSRLAIHMAAKAEPNEDLIPVCTEKERWQSEAVYAVKKTKDAAKAVRGGIFNNKAEADAHASKIGGFVEYRPSVPKRCVDWCSVRQWCNFGRNLQIESDE